MLVRTQVAIHPEHRRRAPERASALGISLAAYIRRLVARDVDCPEPRADPAAVFDLGDSRGRTVGRNGRRRHP